MPFLNARRAAAAAVLAAACAASWAVPLAVPAGAQAAIDAQSVLETFDAATPIVTFDGGSVTLGDLQREYQAIASSIPPDADPEILYRFLFATLERRALLSRAAELDGLPDDAEIQRRLEAARREVLAQAFLERAGGFPPTPEDIEALYEEQRATAPTVTETRSRHILVETLEEAQAIKAEIDAGADFAELAASRSTGPSGPQGGDLGYMAAGTLVPPFEEAAAALQIGGVSEPVQTSFGWHVIKVEDRREVANFPPLDRVREQLVRLYIQRRTTEIVDSVRPLVGAATPDARPPFEAVLGDQ